jgi:hypothetical protein
LQPDGFVDLLENIVDVGLNYTMAAALTVDGRVIEFGVSGDEIQPPGLTNVIAFDVSGQDDDDDLDYRVDLTRDGRLVVWPRVDSPFMVEIPGVVAIAGGWLHVVALKSDGTVSAWDFGGESEPGVVAGLSNIVAVAAGGMHSVALKSDGTVTAWGENFFGQLDIPEGLSNVVAITASEYHTLALKDDGTLAAWGQDHLGEDPTPPKGLSNVVAIATSGSKSLALVSLPPMRPVLRIAADASNLGRLTLSQTGDLNRVYAIEASEELQTWQWVGYVTNDTGTATFEVAPDSPIPQFDRATGL